TKIVFMIKCCKLLLILNILFSGQAFAQSFTLVKDINTNTFPIASNPEHLTEVNGTLFFVASNTTTGQELWKSDGTASGTVLVKDIYSGLYNSSAINLTNVNGVLYFCADNGVNGQEL